MTLETAGHSTNMEPKRESTIKLRFGAGSRGPNNAEVFKFFGKHEWTNEELSAMYREDFSIFVKFKTEQLMREALAKLGPQTKFEYDDGTSMTVPVTAAAGSFKYVRIFGLPPEVDDRFVATAMSKYGTVQQMIRERFPVETGFPIHNGVRGIHMELVSEIPAQLTIQHVKARIYYDGLQNKCFGCGALDHLKAACPNRKDVNKRLTPAPKSGNGTFANVVINGGGSGSGKAEVLQSESSGMVVLEKSSTSLPPRPEKVPVPSKPLESGSSSKATNPSESEEPQTTDPSRVVEVEQQTRDQPTEGDGKSRDGEQELQEGEQLENGDALMEQIGEWFETKGKGKGKRGRPKKVPESDSSETDTNGRKQFIVPASGADLLEEQARRTRSRSRSASKPAGDNL